MQSGWIRPQTKLVLDRRSKWKVVMGKGIPESLAIYVALQWTCAMCTIQSQTSFIDNSACTSNLTDICSAVKDKNRLDWSCCPLSESRMLPVLLSTWLQFCVDPLCRRKILPMRLPSSPPTSKFTCWNCSFQDHSGGFFKREERTHPALVPLRYLCCRKNDRIKL